MADTTTEPVETPASSEAAEVKIDAAFVASLSEHPEKLDPLDVDQLSEVARVIEAGEVTQEDIDAARGTAAAEETPAATTRTVAKPNTESEKIDEGEAVETARVVDLDAAKARRKAFDDKRAELKAIISAAAPNEDEFSQTYIDWKAKRDEARDQMADLVADFSTARDDEAIRLGERVQAEVRSRKAVTGLDSVINDEPIFKSNINLGMSVAEAQTKIYDPWIKAVVKANGGDPAKIEDVQAAYKRFNSDAAFSATPELKAPENLDAVIVAISARTLVEKHGYTPGAALRHTAETRGLWKTWQDNDRAAQEQRVQDALKGLGKRTTEALDRRDAAPKTAPLGRGAGSPRPSSGAPSDVQSAVAQLQRHELRIKNGPTYTPSELEKAQSYNDRAAEIIQAAILRGEKIDLTA